MLEFLLTMAAGALGGAVLYKLKLPGGLMIGALIGSAAFNVVTAQAYMPDAAKYFAQTVAGAFIGVGVQRQDLVQLPRLIKPLGIILGMLLATNLTAGYVISRVSPLSLITSLMASVPGGLSDIPIIAADLGAETSKVATMQFVRMVAGIGVFPTLIFSLDTRLNRKSGLSETAKAEISTAAAGGVSAETDRTLKAIAVTVAAAVAGGILGYFIKIPASTLIFSMAAVIAVKMMTGKGYLPRRVRQLAQIFSGSYVGCTMTMSDVTAMKYLVVPALILLLCYAVNCLISGVLLQKLFGFERKMALLAATPAGAADMALISADIGVTSPDLVVLQVLRLIMVISIFPQADALFARLAG